jgi:hypothetical protein
MKVHVSWGTSDFSTELEIAIDSREDTQLKILDNHIKDVANCIEAWVEHRRGKNLLSAATTGLFLVEPEFIRELPQLLGLLHSTSMMQYHFGVGVEIEESNTALKYAIKHGDTIALYDDGMLQSEEEDEDPLLKDEGGLQHDEKHGQIAIDQEDPTEAVMRALAKIRDNSESIEKLRQTNPEAYEAFRNITKAMVAMAKQIAEVKTAAEGEAAEGLDKSESLEKTIGMKQSTSDHFGSPEKYNGMGEQLKSMKHVKTEDIGGGLFHHVFHAGPEGEIASHTLSTSNDPHAPHVAQIHGSMTEHMGKPTFQVAMSAANPQFKGSGFGKALYLTALKHHGTMLSDTATTGRADNAWSWMGAQKGVQMTPGQGASPHVATMVKSEDIEECIKSIRLPKPKKTPKRIVHKFPVPPPMVAAAPGSVKDGKIKAASIDTNTLEPRKVGWNGVRAGMVVSPKGSPVSSREPNTE